jgi:hypothetical protein
MSMARTAPGCVLSEGFVYGDARVPLLSQQGIFEPAGCEFPPSIRASPEGPYAEVFLGRRPPPIQAPRNRPGSPAAVRRAVEDRVE